MNQTPGLVCAHHHLYSSLARGMPGPTRPASSLLDVLQQLWWRLDAALDHDIIYWSAAIGALEALECGTTGIVDHHESPFAIEGSLDVVAQACADVGVRVLASYGVTDRWTNGHRLVDDFTVPPSAMTDGARRGLAECERYIRSGGRGMVGIHAAFTCSDATIEAAAGIAADLGVGVHVHVAEDAIDSDAASRLDSFSTDQWLLAHCVHLGGELSGLVAHNPRSNMHNRVGYAHPAKLSNTVVLGSDGIGAAMLDEFRIAFAAHRASDLGATPDRAWEWLGNGAQLIAESADDRVTWSYPDVDSPWHVAYTTNIHAIDVVAGGGEVLMRAGRPTRVDADEIRAKAAEAATLLFTRL